MTPEEEEEVVAADLRAMEEASFHTLNEKARMLYAAAPASAGGHDPEAIKGLLAHCEARAARTMEPRRLQWQRRAAAVRALVAWREAVVDAAVVGWTLTAEHERDPRAAINALLAHAQQIALDPAVSEDAWGGKFPPETCPGCSASPASWQPVNGPYVGYECEACGEGVESLPAAPEVSASTDDTARLDSRVILVGGALRMDVDLREAIDRGREYLRRMEEAADE